MRRERGVVEPGDRDIFSRAQAIVAGATLGALAGPPLAAQISKRLPPDSHPYIGNVISMGVCTLVTIPLLGLLPGFASAG